MNNLITFNSKEFGDIRTLTINHEPWFVGKDVAKALGYGNGNSKSKSLANAINNHVYEEDRRLLSFDDFQGHQNGDPKDINHYGMVIINESGLYALIFGSKLESAKRFKHWVTSEVLPSIRKTGSYTIPDLRTIENKAMLFDRLTGGKENLNFQDSAKALGITQSQLIGWLLRNKMIEKDRYTHNVPTDIYKNSGFFQTINYYLSNGYAITAQTLITPLGLVAFANLLDANGLNKHNMPKHGGKKKNAPGTI